MTTRQFILNNFGVYGKERWCSSVMADSKGNIYSYGRHYPLLFRVDRYIFRNIAGYSSSTGKHISWTYGIDAIDVKLSPATVQLLNSYASDHDKLKAITGDLARERDNIQEQLKTKKRHNTAIYVLLKDQVNQLTNYLTLIGGYNV